MKSATENQVDEICRECEGDNGDYVTLCDYHASLTARVKNLEEALRQIADEPQGPADATYQEVLAACERIARAALAEGRENNG